MNTRRKRDAITKHFDTAAEKYDEGDLAGGDAAAAKGRRAVAKTYGRTPVRKTAGRS